MDNNQPPDDELDPLYRDVFKDPENGTPDDITQAGCLALARLGKEAWNAWRQDNPVPEFIQENWKNTADFSGFDFREESIDFQGFVFDHGARFDGAQFGRNASFNHAQFDDHARFDRAQFGDYAHFDDAQFGGHARFEGVQFGNYAHFDDAQFGKYAYFVSSQFGHGARFDDAQFGRDAHFDGAQFGHNARFVGAQFGNEAPLCQYDLRHLPFGN